MRLFENKKKTEEYKKRAHDLVAQMTLEEKVSQMLFNAPAIERLGVPAYNWWNEALHGVARAGTATVFPQAIGMAAAFDEDLVHTVGDAISTEARGKFNAQQRAGDRDIYKGLTRSRARFLYSSVFFLFSKSRISRSLISKLWSLFRRGLGEVLLRCRGVFPVHAHRRAPDVPGPGIRPIRAGGLHVAGIVLQL